MSFLAKFGRITGPSQNSSMSSSFWNKGIRRNNFPVTKSNKPHCLHLSTFARQSPRTLQTAPNRSVGVVNYPTQRSTWVRQVLACSEAQLLGMLP
ncbi:hypothetical protein BRADI_2g37803v3 [Brachypodium distachyon]|uniref:Uncharacterized protein n=1 Tax=Brachypodium distachyon TaxID=15368 RepID=A0A2K2DCF0_BRADI|nr:hypothetical protein BRADI_2g37803v3 [Brachypodium distachyon]